jgi:hypothetical protein
MYCHHFGGKAVVSRADFLPIQILTLYEADFEFFNKPGKR